jgi:ABC-type cobalamin/Fe3+-siderophores transport system ATPase subunit
VFPLSALDVARQGRVARLGPWRRPGPDDDRLAHRALERAGVAAVATSPFRDLSGGLKQRVLIARALASEPALMVLDEPTAGLDAASERDLMDLLVALGHEHALTIVLASHDLELVANYARRIALVDRERRVFRVGRDAEMLTDATLSQLYGRAMRVGAVDGWRVILAGGAAC